ncbi:MAG: magnesium and cobalt transport protein CorA [Corynebacterium sp.]|uniref:magnesium and cobalt transport protein CorA n=1 Tax=Corynebacterium sp. TaxID=1720 RepID=UPI0026DCC61E|nr:magnesium and cobalt transport protein CorA [Corynebacterium sp.]MDO5029449.1 magnesium and cobalt transport protein CorA [Corynebacterium sp.]
MTAENNSSENAANEARNPRSTQAAKPSKTARATTAAKTVAKTAVSKVTRSNNSSSSEVTPTAETVRSALRDCGVYIGGKRLPGTYDHRSGLAEVRRFGEGFTWLSLSRPNATQMDAIAELYGLDDLTVEDALTNRQRPKIEIHEDHVVFVVRSIHYSPEGLADDENEIIRSGQLMIVIGPEYVITIRMGMPSSDMQRISNRVENTTDAIDYGPAGVLWALTDNLVDAYLRIAYQLEDRVEIMEDAVFEVKSESDIEEVYILKREILEMRHAIMPLTPALRSLMNLREDMMPKEISRYLSDVLDHQLVAADLVAGLDERLSALIDAAAVKIQIQQNQDMRTISAYAAILAVPTALAGIYGMNFDKMPELHWEYGYFIVLAIMFAIVAFLIWLLRRNKWL